jgi:hypothetical protein
MDAGKLPHLLCSSFAASIFSAENAEQIAQQ